MTLDPGPLDGLRVVAMAGLGPGPYASMLLADLGADVVRVIRPAQRQARASVTTAGLTSGQDVVNRGTRSVAIDIASLDGVESVLQLLARADVLIEGFRPGVMERRGLGPDAVHERRPELVYARLTGYGQQGPLSSSAGHDINYVAHSGVLHAMSPSGRPPRPALNLLGDYAGGGLIGALGILAAVLRARTCGRGDVLDVAMIDGLALLTAKLQGLRAAGALADNMGDDWLGGEAPFYTTYRCADDRYVAVGALESDFFAAFLAGLDVDVSDWPTQHDRARWPELRARIAEVIATRSMAHWAATYAGTDACVSGVLTFEEAATDPHNRQRDLYVRVEGVLHPAPAPRFDTARPRRTPRAVAPQTDVAEVLRSWAT